MAVTAPSYTGSTRKANGLRMAVALCTCNGERFLQAQLDSYLGQSRKPDQLVVCDDASDDGSFAILEAFAARAPFAVLLRRNPVRLGIGANFEQAIRLCDADIIALSDQDDIWLPHKLERFAAAFAASPEIGWAFCDAKLVDAELHPLGLAMWDRVSFTHSERSKAGQGRMFNILLKHYLVAGATMAFRKELREYLLPIPGSWPYDAWLALVAAAVSQAGMVDEPMQLYRQHDTNAVGGRRESLIGQIRRALQVDRAAYYRSELARWGELALRLDAAHAPSTAARELAAKLDHLGRRAVLPSWRLGRLPGISAEIARGGYARYARNWGSIALDLLFR